MISHLKVFHLFDFILLSDKFKESIFSAIYFYFDENCYSLALRNKSGNN